MNLELGRYCIYKDPKDGTKKIGTLISFDDNTAVVWNSSLKCPYAIHRAQIIDEKKEDAPNVMIDDEFREFEKYYFSVNHFTCPKEEARNFDHFNESLQLWKACCDSIKKNEAKDFLEKFERSGYKYQRDILQEMIKDMCVHKFADILIDAEDQYFYDLNELIDYIGQYHHRLNKEE